MPEQSRLSYIQHMVLMMVIAVVGWAVFLGLFLLIFTDNYEPSVSRTVWWVWLIVGTIVTVITMFVCFRLLQTPRQWRSSAAIALFAPAMCLDALTTTYYNDWFEQGVHDDTAYSALILGAAGIGLLLAMLINKPTADKS